MIVFTKHPLAHLADGQNIVGYTAVRELTGLTPLLRRFSDILRPRPSEMVAARWIGCAWAGEGEGTEGSGADIRGWSCCGIGAGKGAWIGGGDKKDDG